MSAKNTAAPALPDVSFADVRQQTADLVHSSTVWLHHHWLQILIALAAGVVLALALFTARRLGEKLARRSKTGKGWPAIIGNTIRKTSAFFIVTLSARLVSGYAGPPAEVSDTIRFLFTIASVLQFAVWAREIILGAIEHRTRAETYSGEALVSALGLIRLLVTFAVFAVASVVVLDNLGVNVTGLVAGLGVGGIAIGLAAQGIFADLFAALAIIFDRPFRRGDKISYDQTSGVIEAIGLKSTRIRAFTGELRVISNRNLLDKEIQNTSVRDHVRTQLTVGVAYETPPDTLTRVPAILTEVVESAGGKVARASFETFGQSTLDFILQVDTPGDDWGTAHATRDRVMVGIIRRFADEGITLPYPTQTTFTAAPDGRLIMPYAEPQSVQVVPPANDSAGPR